MSTTLQTPINTEELIQRVALSGDLSGLTISERWVYYEQFCRALALDPITRPFDLLETTERGHKRITLYPNAQCAAQLSDKREISIELSKPETIEGVYQIKATASVVASRGELHVRSVQATGAVWIEGLQGQARANAIMKAETKATRRAVLRLCGLAMPDESEVADIPDARPLPTPILDQVEDQPYSIGETTAVHDELDAAINRIWQEHCDGKSLDAWLRRTPHNFHTNNGLQSLSLELKERLLEHMQKSATDKAFSAWKCDKRTGLALIGVCERLQQLGISEAEWRAELETFWGVTSRKALEQADAENMLSTFTAWCVNLAAKREGNGIENAPSPLVQQ